MPTGNNCRLFRALRGLMIELSFYHQFMFLPERHMAIGDRMVTVAGSTARLTTAEMMDYIDRCIALASELGWCVVAALSSSDICPHARSSLIWRTV
jgi:hypothetical protein